MYTLGLWNLRTLELPNPKAAEKLIGDFAAST
jgi:hypothetical protein